MAWRVAKSLLTLRAQIDARYPTRNKASDGTIGNAEHATRDSDHNPWWIVDGQGVVTALDITHDPANGVDIDRLTDELAASRDPRIKYLIANGLIMDTRPEFRPWMWRHYGGSNAHTRHFHLSVMPGLCDDDRPWRLPSLTSGGPAAGGGDDDMQDKDFQRLEKLMWSVLRGWANNPWHEPTQEGDQPDMSLRGTWLHTHGYAVGMVQKLNALANLVARQGNVSADEIAEALRAGLSADLLPALREELTRHLLSEQAETISTAVVDELTGRLAG